MPLKIGIIGAGNIGTAIAALLSHGGAEVYLTARGARLTAIRNAGVSLDDRGTVIEAAPQVSEVLDQPMDALFVCVKSQDFGAAILANKAALTGQTWVVPMINGLPFWFFATPKDMGNVPFMDPEGHLRDFLRPEQVLGAVLLMTVRTDETGRALSSNTPTLSLGPVTSTGGEDQLQLLLDALEAGGVRTDVTADIRKKMMVKLLANFATNPLSALSGAMLDEIGKDEHLRTIATTLADEFRAGLGPLGHDLPPNAWLVDLLLDAGTFPTSMLQDTLAGKPLELDAICRAPLKVAQEAGQDMPMMRRLLAMLEASSKLPVPAADLSHHLAKLLQNSHERIIS